MKSMIETCVGKLAVYRTGPPDAPTLLFWHSMFVDHAMFAAQTEAFSVDYQCIAVDAPGHGASGMPPQRFELADCATAAEELCSSLGIETLHWIGCALGGHVGVTLAARRSPLLRSLLVLNSPMHPMSGFGRARAMALVQAFGLLGPRAFLTGAVTDALLLPSSQAEHGEYLRLCLAGPDREALLRAMHSVMLGRKSLVEKLGNIEVPTLFVTGDDDYWPPELAAQHVALVPGGRLEVTKGSRHLTPLEEPEWTNRLIAEWLAEVRS